MTSQGCPSHVTIMEQVRNRLAGIPEISESPGQPGVGTGLDAGPHQPKGPGTTGYRLELLLAHDFFDHRA